MLRYITTAGFYKLMSYNSGTRQAYNFMGNKIGNFKRGRKVLPKSYLHRIHWMKEFLDEYRPLKPTSKILSLGTGWVHADSLVIRLLYDVETVLFDVTDKRQLGAFKQHSLNLLRLLYRNGIVTKTQLQIINQLIQNIQKVETYSQLYELLNWKYVLEKSGSLQRFPDNTFDFLYSYNVLEHVNISLLPQYISDFTRILKPGGYSLHKIDLTDHFSHYDQKVSKKNYLSFSNKLWETYFENKILYINRIPRSIWLQYFEQSKLSLIEESSEFMDISCQIHEQHRHQTQDDIQCVALYILHQKRDDLENK